MILSDVSELISIFSKKPEFTLVLIIIWWLLKMIDRRVGYWLDNKQTKQKEDKLNKTRVYNIISKIAAEFNVDKVYIFSYTKDRKQLSMTYEYSPSGIPDVAHDYQDRENIGFYHRVTDLLLLNDKVLYHDIDHIKDPDKKLQLSYYGLNSWYSFALKDKQREIKASLNLCFKSINGLSVEQISALEGKVSHIERIYL